MKKIIPLLLALTLLLSLGSAAALLVLSRKVHKPRTNQARLQSDMERNL